MQAQAQQTKNQKQFFRIHLKPDVKPQEAFKVYGGTVEENSIVTGQEVKVYLDPPECNIPNFYTHHVVKEYDAKGNYNGKFKFVNDFASEKETIESIEVRYVSNCPSLDKQWQIKNGYKPKDYIEEFGWAFPSNFVAEFDLKTTPPLMIEFLKHHQGCEDNPNRDPNNGIIFRLVNAEKNIAKKREGFAKEQKKFEFLNNIHSSDEIVNVYAYLFGVSQDYEPEIKRDEVLNKVEAMTTEGAMKFLDDTKKQYKSIIQGWVDNKDVAIKKSKIYVGKNPEASFRSVEFVEGSTRDIISQLAELATSNETVYKEFEQILIKTQQ